MDEIVTSYRPANVRGWIDVKQRPNGATALEANWTVRILRAIRLVLIAESEAAASAAIVWRITTLLCRAVRLARRRVAARHCVAPCLAIKARCTVSVGEAVRLANLAKPAQRSTHWVDPASIVSAVRRTT